MQIQEYLVTLYYLGNTQGVLYGNILIAFHNTKLLQVDLTEWGPSKF